MRLDHLLSKDRLSVGWLPGRLLLSGPLYGSGPAGGCSRGYAGRPTVVHWCAGWLACLVIGVGNTPVMLLLPACVGSVAWWVPLACLVCVGVACCRGSGAVRPGLPGPSRVPFLGVLGGCGWVGCELYSGREHLTVRFLRQSIFLVLFVCLCCLFF